MQAVIMAGGKGTRLRSLTNDTIPKPLAPINGKPILRWQIESLKRCGIRDITIIIGYLGEKIREALGNGSGLGVTLRYFQEETPLGTAGALAYMDVAEKGREFLLVYGDCVFDIDVERMAQFHRRSRALVTLFAHPNAHSYDSDLLLLDNSGRVIGIRPKNEPRGGWNDNMVNAGLYIVSREVCAELPKGKPVDFEKEYLAGKLPLGDIFAYCSSEYIKDAGTPERIAQVSADLERGVVAARNLRYGQKCVFLDRDGTVNAYKGLIYRPEDFELVPIVAEAIRALNASGYLVIVVTNQPVVARGLCGIETVEEIHRKMKTLLGAEGAYVDAVYYCPHHPDKGFPEENPEYKVPCECRKPDIGMLRQAIKEFNILPELSWMVGDTTVDILTGKNAGLKTALVRTGMAGKDGKYQATPDSIHADLLEAAQFILGKRGSKMDYAAKITAYIQRETEILRSLDVAAIDAAMNLLQEAHEAEKNIYIFGNGGSAATASHYTNDFNKGISEYTTKKFRFQCLNDNMATVMAIANDISYDEIFRFQLRGRLAEGDLIVAISGSGNSKNVLNAVQFAREQGNRVIGLTGYNGGALKTLSDVSLHVPVDSMQITEDVHMVFDHLMMSIFYETLEREESLAVV